MLIVQLGWCLFVDHCGPRRRWCRRSCRRLFPDRGGCGYCIIADAADEEVVQKKKYPFPPQSVNKFAAEFQAEVPENESKFNFQHVVWKKPKNSTRTVNNFPTNIKIQQHQGNLQWKEEKIVLSSIVVADGAKQNYTDTHAPAHAHARPPGRLFNCVHVSSVQL
ncbi:hypothetical protein T03_3989 [Trichinella britovi]|uniref:Uncharacterized protein n=1 Tax=Trichinella britovi TaxID=45882 RepID=A0A0V1CZY1_TRIBR|nr:hypothetical protein T03_3989 [Trichinella britovi]